MDGYLQRHWKLEKVDYDFFNVKIVIFGAQNALLGTFDNLKLK